MNQWHQRKEDGFEREEYELEEPIGRGRKREDLFISAIVLAMMVVIFLYVIIIIVMSILMD